MKRLPGVFETRRVVLFLFCLLAAAGDPVARATNLTLSIRSDGFSGIFVDPGDSVHYEVFGDLTDSNNEGLAGFVFDLCFEGGSLIPVDTPSSVPMVRFTIPDGVTNPAGFGGSVIGDCLVQIGGAQNTIKNTGPVPSYPIGIVIPGVAQTPTVLATGTLVAPTTPGTYQLKAANLSATVIRDNESGTPFWAADVAPAGTISYLNVVVRVCSNCQLYGDTYPTGGNCAVDLDDIICVLDGFANRNDCPDADIVGCGGNGVVDIDDIIAVLDAFTSAFRCPHPCPPS